MMRVKLILLSSQYFILLLGRGLRVTRGLLVQVLHILEEAQEVQEGPKVRL